MRHKAGSQPEFDTVSKPMDTPTATSVPGSLAASVDTLSVVKHVSGRIQPTSASVDSITQPKQRARWQVPSAPVVVEAQRSQGVLVVGAAFNTGNRGWW